MYGRTRGSRKSVARLMIYSRQGRQSSSSPQKKNQSNPQCGIQQCVCKVVAGQRKRQIDR